MKNKKLLMPIAGVAALGTVTPVIMAATSCNKNTVTLDSISVTDTKTERLLGSTINRAELVVTAKYSDETTAQILDWTCDDFVNGQYTFGSETEHTFTIKYKENDVEKETTLKVELKIPSTVSFGLQTYYLAVDSNSGVSTTEKLSLIGNETGYILDAGLFNFSIETADQQYATIDSNGVITALKGTNTAGITVTAKWKDTSISQTAITCKVIVEEITNLDNNITLDDDTLTAEYWVNANVLATTSTTVVVPRTVSITTATNAVKTYTVTSIDVPYEIIWTSVINTLTIPNTVTYIGQNAFANRQLFNVYYNGTVEEYEDACQHFGDDWYGEHTLGIQCLDGFVAIDGRLDTTVHDEVTSTTAGKYLSIDQTIGSVLTKDTYTIRFDMSKLGKTAAEIVGVEIHAYHGALWSTYVDVAFNNVYIDGVKATLDTDYTVNTGKITFTDPSTAEVDLTEKSIVTVELTTPRGQTFLNKIHVVAADLA